MTASVYVPLSDPAGSGALLAAVSWLQGSMLGTVATMIAVIAVAAVGALMLGGRIDWRRGATVIAGCFVLFGAGSVVAGKTGLAGSGDMPTVYVGQPVPLPPKPPAATPQPTPYDPYARAAVR